MLPGADSTHQPLCPKTRVADFPWNAGRFGLEYARDASPNGYYVANLDTYGGNSGSAVFNAKTGVIEGILMRGENDYVYKNGCRVSNVCASDACRGEDVTKLSSITSSFQKASPARAEAPATVAKASPAFEMLKTISPEAN